VNLPPERVFPIFFGVWIVLCLASWSFFFFNRNAALKRKVLPPFVVFVGILFLAFTALMGLAREPFFFVVMFPAVAVISYLNIRNTQFCDACGRTVLSRNPFFRANFCPKCGAALNAKTD
jgi:hypothetical protein